MNIKKLYKLISSGRHTMFLKLLIFLQSRLFHALCALLLVVMLALPITGPQSVLCEDFGCMEMLPGYHCAIMMFRQGDWNRFFTPSSSIRQVWSLKPYGPVIGLLVMGMWALVLAGPVICHKKLPRCLLAYFILTLLLHSFWLLLEWREESITHVSLAMGEYLIVVPPVLSFIGFASAFKMRNNKCKKKYVSMIIHTIATISKRKANIWCKISSWLIIIYLQFLLLIDFFEPDKARNLIELHFGGDIKLAFLVVILPVSICSYALYKQRFFMLLHFCRPCRHVFNLRHAFLSRLVFTCCWFILANIRFLVFYSFIPAFVSYFFKIGDDFFYSIFNFIFFNASADFFFCNFFFYTPTFVVLISLFSMLLIRKPFLIRHLL